MSARMYLHRNLTRNILTPRDRDMAKKMIGADDPLVTEQISWMCHRIRELREGAGFTLSHVGSVLGCSSMRIGETERNRYKDMQMSTVCRITQALGVSMQTFMSGCPGGIQSQPPALQKGSEVNYLVRQMQKLDDEQFKQFSKEVSTEKKRRAA